MKGLIILDITQEQLDKLISCPKRITKPPKKGQQDAHVNKRSDFSVICDDTGEEFIVFVRYNTILTENFSIGLVWLNKNIGSSIIILRCNGLHGGNKNVEHHNVQHIHTLNIELAQNDIFKEDTVTITKEYSTLNDALFYFSRRCNIIGMEKHFPGMMSIPLFGYEE